MASARLFAMPAAISVNSLPYDPGTFDLVLRNHLLNDLEDPAQAVLHP
jgi:hypothetical protein